MEILPSSIDQFLTLKTGYFTGFIIMTELSPSVLTNTFKKKKKKKFVLLGFYNIYSAFAVVEPVANFGQRNTIININSNYVSANIFRFFQVLYMWRNSDMKASFDLF